MKTEERQGIFSDMSVNMKVCTPGFIRKIVKGGKRHNDFIADSIGINNYRLGCLSEY